MSRARHSLASSICICCALSVSACAPAASSTGEKIASPDGDHAASQDGAASGTAGTSSTASTASASGTSGASASSVPSSGPAASSSASASAPASASASAPPVASTSASAAPSATAPAPIPPNTVVLHIGESFLLAGFAQALKPRMKALGVRYEVRSEQSSYTTTWAGKMERLVADTQPDLVLVNIGANEVSNIDPPTHAPAVKRIVKFIGNRPCVWISPPLWRKDTGIINVMRENSAPCRFFDSDLLVTQPIPRTSDKIHPSISGGAVWAAAFWDWLEAQRAPASASPPELLPNPASPGTSYMKRSPWLLKPSPPEEHQPPPASSAASGASPAPPTPGGK